MQLSDLYQKVQAFEAQQSAELRAKSQCQQGCSRCCYVDLSVFEVEAENIRGWFLKLSPEAKSELKQLWTTPPTTAKNFFEQEVSACPFLRNEACTIYEARPLICRTQGLPLSFKEAAETYVDVCPLNDDMLDVASEKDLLNLDLVNRILSEMEAVAAGGELRQRVRLSSLQRDLAAP